MQTFKMIEGWPLLKIKQRYLYCTKHCPEQTKPDIRWWSLRKHDKE
jgi:hypothetical protein